MVIGVPNCIVLITLNRSGLSPAVLYVLKVLVGSVDILVNSQQSFEFLNEFQALVQIGL